MPATVPGLKIYTNITKKPVAILAKPTSTTTDATALKFFPDTMQTIKKLSV